MAASGFSLVAVCVVCSLASANRDVIRQHSCSSADICGSRQVINCESGRVILIDRILPRSFANVTCDAFTNLPNKCNYQTTCDMRFLNSCCQPGVTSLTVEYFCINVLSIDDVCHQSPKEAIPAATRHIYPRMGQSTSTGADDVTKLKPPFCQWKIPIPKNVSVAFRIHQLSKASGTCRTTPSLLIQYDVANKKRPKYVRGVPACAELGGSYVYRLKQAAPQVLVWFTPSSFTEKLWLSFEFINGPTDAVRRYVTPNSTRCLAMSTVAGTPLTHDAKVVTSSENVNINTTSQATNAKRHDEKSSERMALIAGLAAVATVAALFLVVSIVLFCKLHRLRFLSKGFSRLRKMPGAGFDLVNKRQLSEKSNQLVGSRSHDNNATHGDYRQCEPTVYSVARRPSTEADDNFLKHLEMSMPTYAVPYENMRYHATAPSPKIVASDNNRPEIPERPSIRPRAHVALTDEMLRGGKRSPDEFSSRDWIVPDDDVIDITTGSDVPVPGYYRQSSTVENALYDSPDENEDVM